MEFFKEGAQKLKEGGTHMSREIRQQIIGYVTAAFGLIVGLAWNDAIKSLIEYLFPLGENSLWAKFVYALVLTLILVVATSYLLRMAKKEDHPS